MLAYLSAAGEGMLVVFSWPNILYPVIGTLAAMVTSFLPGASGITLMALALPLTLTWEPQAVVLLFGALVGGATFMGSVTAILFNVPGGAPNAATLLDGYPLAMRGQARTALACAAIASALGSTIGVVLLVALLPAVRPIVLAFGPLEFLLLTAWGLTTIIMISHGSVIKGLAMSGFGLVLALVGLDPVTAEPRWTFGLDYLADGLGPIPVLLGLFAIAEALVLMLDRQGQLQQSGRIADSGSIRAGIGAVMQHRGLLVRSSLIGTLIGMIPGVGGTVASFVAYGHAVQSSPDKSRFGKGDVRGIIAPEASHDAKDGGSLLPVLAFGLPGSEGTVLLVAALTLHGIVPGKPMLEQQLPLAFTLIWALFLSNWLTSILGLAVIRPLARLMTLRTDVLAPVILALGAMGAVASSGRNGDLVVALAFGVLGYFMLRYGWPRVPFVIAFVLGRMLEDNLLLTIRLVELGRLTPWNRPIAIAIVLLTALSVFWMLRGQRRGAPSAAVL